MPAALVIRRKVLYHRTIGIGGIDKQRRVETDEEREFTIHVLRGRTMRTFKYGALAALCAICLLVISSQLFAFSLPLPMGVTLEGKGTVVSVEPGSAAERAGLQVGDRINRINGR